jgi:flagellar FliJ protein
MPTMQALFQLLDHERRGRDAALLQLRNAEGSADAADTQAQQLEAYRSEYVGRWSVRFRETGSVTLLQCYQDFMQRLEQAIAQQHNAVQLAHARLEQARRSLTDNERRVASVEKLIERRSAQEQRHLARREQTRSDEIALAVHARRAPAAPPTELGDLPQLPTELGDLPH